ncbi:hypothetical protein [Metapseudomonas sp. CR1201]
MVSIQTVMHEIQTIDTRDLAITLGSASIVGGICGSLTQALLPYMDSNLAILIAGTVGGALGMAISKISKKGL